MAENVQFKLESMLPALQDLEQLQLFSKAELKVLVKRRRDFEYALSRRTSQLADYTAYIQFELSLETLRRKRVLARRRSQSAAAGKSGSGKTTVSETAGVRQIHRLYREATQKFPGELSVWRAWLQFSQTTRSAAVLARTFPACLAVHPRSAEIWVLAAEWEWRESGNVNAARGIMLRALKFVGDSEAAWLAYFRLELLFLGKVLGRRELLGIADGDAAHKNKASALNTDSLPDEASTEAPVLDAGMEKFLSGALPALVAGKALEACNTESMQTALIDAYMDAWRRFPALQSACETGLQIVREHIQSKLVASGVQ